jgi:hypothetical protein
MKNKLIENQTGAKYSYADACQKVKTMSRLSALKKKPNNASE